MVLHNTNLGFVNCITIDYDNQVLYWADDGLNKIESSDVDGSNRRTLTTIPLETTSIYYYNGMLYWGDNSINRVVTGPATQPGSGTILGGSFDAHSIRVVSRDSHPLG